MTIKTRMKKVLITEQLTKTDAEKIFSEYAIAEAEQRRIEADLDVKINKLREEHQDVLSELEKMKKTAFEKLQHFAINNPLLFEKRKSLYFPGGAIGFRTSTPALKLLKGYSWTDVTNCLKSLLPDYVRIVEEPAKDKLIANRDEENIRQHFHKVGIKVTQQETFFVEPKSEEVLV